MKLAVVIELEPIQPGAEILSAQAAFLEFVKQELTARARSSRMAGHLWDYLRQPHAMRTFSEGTSIEVDLNYCGGTASWACEATAHVMSELAFRRPGRTNALLKPTGWRLADHNRQGRELRESRFMMFRDAPCSVHIADVASVDHIWEDKPKEIPPRDYGLYMITAVEYIDAPVHDLEIRGDFGKAKRVSSLSNSEREATARFWISGSCQCPICAAHDPEFNPEIGLQVAEQFDEILDQFAVEATFRLRFDRREPAWRIMHVSDNGDGTQFARIPCTPGSAPSQQVLIESLARAGIRSCEKCEDGRLKPEEYVLQSAPALRCVKCHATFTIDTLL